MVKNNQQNYKKLDSITHIHTRPDMYIGTNKSRVMDNEFMAKEDKIEFLSNVSVNDGFVRIFLEAVSNAIDNFYRSKDGKTPMTKLTVTLDEETGWTSVWNDGNHIPVEIHNDENIYIPELIFGHLLSGSNYDDNEERLTSGRNGLGVKLLNVFSNEFKIECYDNEKQLLYKQTWTDHMKKCGKPKVTNKTLKSAKSGYTKISWLPDFSLFGMEKYDTEHVNIYKKYVMDAAMIMKIPVFWNEEKFFIKKFSDYVKFYTMNKGECVEGIMDDLEYCICEASTGVQQISFVNGMYTRDGGVHVDKLTGELFKIICGKLPKLKIMPKDIKHYFTIFINATVVNPEFSSQSKTRMVSCQSPLKIDFPNKVINSILKWDFVNDIIEMNKMKEMMNLKKTEKKRGYRRIDGLDPANFAGTKQSKDCILILCEGLSAKTYSTQGISKGFDNKKGRNFFGIYPLRGKCLNVRNATLKSVSENKEITDIIHCLNLRFNVDYTKEEEFKTLSYGKVCIITDADEDGHHICSLLLNLFHKLFPSLLQREPAFFSIMMTPIAKIKWSKTNIETFYNDHDYQNALMAYEGNSKFEVKYYKGLGTSSDAEIKESFGEKVVCFKADPTTDTHLNMIFHKNFSSERKDWLLTNDSHVYQVPDKEYPITLYLNQELIKYSLEDCKRSIPCLFDGLKVSQRKILFSVFRKNLNYSGKSMKVAQLAGYCAEQSNYHHGEQCLYETIIKMSHHFPGSNNVPYFERDGQFGSRVYGGKDAANARYIFTKLGPITRLLFPELDDVLLEYTLDDGVKVEPGFYIPIVPTILLNGCTAGIGTGWSCFLPCFSFKDVVDKIKLFLNGKKGKFQLKPHYDKFEGKIEKIDENKYQTFGILKDKEVKKKKVYEITELPIGTWTDKYKCELEVLQENKKIKNLKNYSSTEKVHFEFEEGPTSMEYNTDTLKLKTNLNLTNMVLFVENDKIRKFKNVHEIFSYYFDVRLELYQKRIQHQIEQTERQLEISQNKSRFILAVVKKEIELFNKTEETVEELLNTKNFVKMEDSYDYLLRIPLRDLTKNKYNQLKEKIKELEELLKKLKETTPEGMWEEDLDKLEKEYNKHF
jgi:DNA topoisomerase-2